MESEILPSALIKQMAEIGWTNQIKGDSLERHSLMYPLTLVFDQIRKKNEITDIELIRTSSIQKIYDYLERIGKIHSKNREDKKESITKLVDIFFIQLLGKLYKNKIQIILSDEKNLKASYLFYVRNFIPSKDNKDKGEE